jgi:hypothetical protein
MGRGQRCTFVNVITNFQITYKMGNLVTCFSRTNVHIPRWRCCRIDIQDGLYKWRSDVCRLVLHLNCAHNTVCCWCFLRPSPGLQNFHCTIFYIKFRPWLHLHAHWKFSYRLYLYDIQGDQKVSVQLMITIQKSDAQRLFVHPVYSNKNCCVHS